MSLFAGVFGKPKVIHLWVNGHEKGEQSQRIESCCYTPLIIPTPAPMMARYLAIIKGGQVPGLSLKNP